MNTMKRDVTIRIVDKDEVDILTEYRLEYLDELQGSVTDKYKEELRRELNKYFSETIENNHFFALMAIRESNIVSFGGMVIKKIPGDINKAFYLEGDILNMYTIPCERRKGYSSLILKELLMEATKRGISKVSLHTSKDGEVLYRKFGFKDPTYPVLELLTNK